MSFPVTIDGETFQESEFANYGWITRLAALTQRISNVAADVAADLVLTNADVVSTNADVVSTAADVVSTNADVVTTGNNVTAAQAAQAAAEAAVVGAQLPVANTGGTGSAYTFTDSDLVIGDASAIRVNFHTANLASPTVEETTDGNAYEIVDRGNRSLDAGEIATGATYILLYDTLINKWIVQNLALVKLINTLDANAQTIDNARLTNTPITYDTPCPIGGTLVVDTDYVVGHYSYDCTLEGGEFDPELGSGTVEFYLSPDKTSAGGTLITGGTFDALDASTDTPDKNTFTANNTVTSGAERYLIAKPTSVTSLKNIKGSITETKNSEDK